MSQVRNFLMLTKLNSKCSICTIFKSPTPDYICIYEYVTVGTVTNITIHV